MSTIAELLVHVGVSDDVDKGMGSIQKKIAAGADKMVTSGRRLTRNVTLPLAAAGAGLFALAGAQEEAEAKLSSSFESMGAAAWTSVDALKANASAIQEMTTFGDEAILDFQSVLLTFGNVTGDVFSDATRLGADMSAKLGQDLQSSAIQLGKALNDPVKGVTALSRVGVSFTEDQKDMIKTMSESGDIAGAQAVILGELEKQFGGTAEAMAQTNSGKAKQAMNALGDAGEVLGGFVAPMVGKLADWLKKLSGWFQKLSPEAQQWVVRLGAVAAAVGPVLIIGGKLIKGFMAIKQAFTALSLAMSLNPWVLLIAAVVALVVIIVKNWDKIVAFLKGVWDWIKNAAGAVGQWISDAFKKAVDFVKNLFLNFTPLGLIIKNFDKIKEIATGAKDWIVEKFNQVVDFFKGLPSRIASAAAGLWDGIKNAFRSAINWVIDKWNNFGFKAGFDIPSIFGGGRVEIGFNTPNIPRLHDGGIFNAPSGHREGLALLEDGERVTSAKDTKNGGPGATYNLFTLSKEDFLRELRAAGVELDKLGWR